MRTPGVHVGATGAFLPPVVPVRDAVADGRLPAADAERYGITHVALAGELPAPEMAVSAARQALDRWGGPSADVSLVLYVSTWYQGPHGWGPQYFVQRHTGTGAATAAEVRQGCMGFFSGIDLAATHLMAVPEQRAALVVTADNYNSPAIDRWTSTPHSLLSDGSAALLLTRDPGVADLLAVNSLTLPQYESRHRPDAPLFPPEATTGRRVDLGAAKSTWQAAEPASAASVAADMARARDLVVGRTLADAGLHLRDVTRVAVVNWSHERVEERVMAPLGLPMSLSTWDFGRTVGHVGAADQILSLDRLLQRGEVRPGDVVMLFGTGPGANIACALMRITAPGL